MHRPAFVYFDLGNVLCFFNHEISARQMAEVAGTDTATIRRLVFESDLENHYEHGLITGQQFVAEIARHLGCSLDTEAMLEAASAMFTPNLDMLPILKSIRDLNISMGILSNTNQAHWEWIRKQNYPILNGWFDPIVLSYEVHVMKPAHAIFHLAAERAGFPPDQIFFTDDRLDNIHGAQTAFWQVSQFVDAKTLLAIVSSWV